VNDAAVEEPVLAAIGAETAVAADWGEPADELEAAVPGRARPVGHVVHLVLLLILVLLPALPL
jgi:hypothetical protein